MTPPEPAAGPPLARRHRMLAAASIASFLALVGLGIFGALRDRGAPPSLSISPVDHIREMASREEWSQVARELGARLRMGVDPAEQPEWIARIGNARLRAGETEAGIAALRESLRLAPSVRDPRLRLLEALRDAGAPELWRIEADAMLRLHPGDADAAAHLADAYTALGRPRSAAAVRAQRALGGAEAPEPACHALEAEGDRARSLVLVVASALRRDRVGAFDPTARTPALDRFTASHFAFDRAVSPAPTTPGAVASLFTGLRPRRHRVGPDATPLDPTHTTLAQALSNAGFATAGIVADARLAEPFALARGFAEYDDAFGARDVAGGDVTARAQAWLAQQPAHTPYFLYLHYVDARAPYGALDVQAVQQAATRLEQDTRPVPGEARRALRALRTLEGEPLLEAAQAVPRRSLLEVAYDAGIAEFDAAFGDLLATLEARPDWPGTAVVVTADHGEPFFENGHGTEVAGLHDDELAIPLAARLPGVVAETSRIACTTSLMDLPATLCDTLGVDCPTTADARSLLAAPTAAAPRYVVSEGVPDAPEHRAVRNARFKLIHAPRGPVTENGARDTARGRSHPERLYDLRVDPKERRDLLRANAQDPRVAAIATALRDALAAPPSAGSAAP